MSTEPDRVCITCAHCRSVLDGNSGPYDGHDRAYCVEPVIVGDAGRPVPCETERFNEHGVCGTDGHLWTQKTPR